jgi:hypothetical protein
MQAKPLQRSSDLARFAAYFVLGPTAKALKLPEGSLFSLSFQRAIERTVTVTQSVNAPHLRTRCDMAEPAA